MVSGISTHLDQGKTLSGRLDDVLEMYEGEVMR
jgi:hypothetical protein